MKCSQCNQEIAGSHCPQCDRNPHNLSNDQSNRVIEPELITEEEYSHRNMHATFQNQRAQFIYPTDLQNSCMPSFITLFLTIAAWIQFGFLAALGFVFFIIIGKVFTIYIQIHSLLQNKYIPPLLMNFIIWGIAYALVAWLSD